LLEIDVTVPRRILRDYKARTGESVSFTAFIITCLARAIEMNKEVHAFLNWRSRLVIYDDANVNVMVEVDSEQGKIVIPRSQGGC
jgi:pyruvate/2-oxoglutarate dehydrogenase complex dihydrolipoamide acyltransferase (E2) component